MKMIHNGFSNLRTCFRLPLPETSLSRPLPHSLPFRRRCLATVSAAANKEKEKVIVISGPTGTGKSRLALELAKRLNGEIVSADSIQVYQGLDIGSAKPSQSDRKEVPHHLVDILHPCEDYSVGQFFEDARQATRSILDKGRVPIVVGGTGLYLRWFIYGKPDVPIASQDITSKVHLELAELQRKEEWDAAVQLVVKAGDPKAQLLAVNDWYRLRRSLEIIKSSGSPPSAFRVPYDSFRDQDDLNVTDGSGANTAEETNTSDLDYEFMCFFLSVQRLELYKSLDYRCEEMLLGRDGILSEAQWLLNLGLLPNSNSATRGIGYRQAMEYLLSCRQLNGQSSVGEFYKFLSEFQKVSRNFAKRQLTWFRNEKIYNWLDASKPLETVLDFIVDSYQNRSGSLVVPGNLRMPRDITSHREANLIKSYRTRNRHFVRREDCSHILDWIGKTQSGMQRVVNPIEGNYERV
ncbi:tRNA dimethylallyltransferase 9 [Stylosanthes scabra]|uniref:tRNA dimethylallyltransferase n=1 Tax=Stylosanthes scabra TaxID=79078 RepID=A0ABU6SG30_9FABA|nr:tRNA dimethylallyltransferase 9 [Stylosanthes scabra]